MEFYTCKQDGEKEILTKAESFWEALSLTFKEHMTVAFVGGGGKTSAMFALADELAGQGKQVIVTTSTHIFCPLGRTVIPAGRADMVKRFLSSGQKKGSYKSGFVVVTGQQAPEGKLMGMAPLEMEQLAGCADVLLVEADGAKGLPLKLPKAGEPALLESTDVVLGFAGLDCIGKTYGEQCFRMDLAGEIFEGGRKEEERISPEDVAHILTSDHGTRKGVKELEYRIVLNKAEGEKRLMTAKQVISCLGAEWKNKCAVTSFLGS